MVATQRGKTTPRKLGRPPSTDSGATRLRIIDAARRLFASLGYEATTNNDIASAAGLTTGALYHYFDSKVELYIEVFDECIRLIYDRFGKVATDAGGLVSGLCAIADDAVALQASDPTLSSFLSAAGVEAPRHPELTELTQHHRSQSSALWRGIVDAGVATGELPADVDRKATAAMIGAIYSGFGLLAVRTDARAHARAFEAFKLLVRGQLIAGYATAEPSGSKG